MRPANPWRLEPTLRFLATLLFAFAASAFAIHALALVFGTDPAKPPAPMLAAGTGLFHAVGILALIPFLRSQGQGWRDGFGLGTSPWHRTVLFAVGCTLPALAAAWGVHHVSSLVLEALGQSPDSQAAVDAVRGASRPWERGLLLFFAAGTAPIFEELIFRGVFWPALRDRGFRVMGCLLVSFLFALIHANVAAFLPLALLGVFWTWLYEKTGDISVPILSHALFNATNFLWILALPAASPSSP
jgi:membrane protease YdiL (CAAX protease family)